MDIVVVVALYVSRVVIVAGARGHDAVGVPCLRGGVEAIPCDLRQPLSRDTLLSYLFFFFLIF